MALTKFQKYKLERVARGTIKNAPYNPRKIDQYARKRLKANLKEVGLLEPVIVNRRTMHIVGGHQRLAALDALENKGGYELDVSMVDLTDKQEREQNIFLNNPTAQGTWDLIKLGELLNDTEISLEFEGMGFDTLQLETLFDGTGIELSTGLSIHNQGFDDAITDLKNQQDAAKHVTNTMGDDDSADGEPLYADDDAPEGDDTDDAEDARIAHVKNMKQKIAAKGADDGDTEFLAVIVCRSRAEREAVMYEFGEHPEERYVSSEKFWNKVKSNPKKAADAYEKEQGHPLPSMQDEP